MTMTVTISMTNDHDCDYKYDYDCDFKYDYDCGSGCGCDCEFARNCKKIGRLRQPLHIILGCLPSTANSNTYKISLFISCIVSPSNPPSRSSSMSRLDCHRTAVSTSSEVYRICVQCSSVTQQALLPGLVVVCRPNIEKNGQIQQSSSFS